MDTTTIVTLVVLVVLVLAAVAVVGWLVRRKDEKRRSEQLKDRFGPEYDRSVADADDRRAAERDLQAASERREQLDIRPLTSASRERRTSQWEGVQAMFVDAPVEAVENARTLVVDVMHERGYPTEDSEERTRMLATDHADVVQHQRDAEAYRARYRSGEGSTEDLRQAFVFYRRLFDTLVDDVADTAAPRTDRPEGGVRDGGAQDVPADGRGAHRADDHTVDLRTQEERADHPRR